MSAKLPRFEIQAEIRRSSVVFAPNIAVGGCRYSVLRYLVILSRATHISASEANLTFHGFRVNGRASPSKERF